jgi:hypothetical protein
VALTAGRAAARLGQLLDSGSKRADLDAAKFSLGVAGIKPAADAQVNVNLELRAGYVISVEERDEPAAEGGILPPDGPTRSSVRSTKKMWLQLAWDWSTLASVRERYGTQYRAPQLPGPLIPGPL